MQCARTIKRIQASCPQEVPHRACFVLFAEIISHCNGYVPLTELCAVNVLYRNRFRAVSRIHSVPSPFHEPNSVPQPFRSVNRRTVNAFIPHRNRSVPLAEFYTVTVPYRNRSVPLADLIPLRTSSVLLAEFIPLRNRYVPFAEFRTATVQRRTCAIPLRNNYVPLAEFRTATG